MPKVINPDGITVNFCRISLVVTLRQNDFLRTQKQKTGVPCNEQIRRLIAREMLVSGSI